MTYKTFKKLRLQNRTAIILLIYASKNSFQETVDATKQFQVIAVVVI